MITPDELRSPLPPELYDRLLAAEHLIGPALERCEAGRKCKFNVDGLHMMFQELQQRMQAIRTQFYPNGRPQ